jgi:hypothetical protein
MNESFKGKVKDENPIPKPKLNLNQTICLLPLNFFWFGFVVYHLGEKVVVLKLQQS